MIGGLIFLLFSSMMYFVFGLIRIVANSFGIPVQMPVPVANSITIFTPIWGMFQAIFPVEVLLYIFIMILGFEVSLQALRFFLWLMKKLPGIS